MEAKKKKLSYLAIGFLLIALIVVTSVFTVWAAKNQKLDTAINVKYTSEQVAGTASAKYYIGSADSTGKQMTTDGEAADDNTTVTFDAQETAVAAQTAKTLKPVTSDLESGSFLKLTDEKTYILFEYKFTNSSDHSYKATLTFTETKEENVTYTTYYSSTSVTNAEFDTTVNGTGSGQKGTSLDNLTVTVPQSSEGYYVYIKVAINKLEKGASFEGTFNWALDGTQAA